MSTQPHRQCASVLITNSKGEVLFIRQAYGKQRYGFPGGIVDVGETPPQAAVREVFEEVGLKVRLEYVIGTYLLQGGGWPDIFASVYFGVILEGSPTINQPEEIAEVLWRTPENLPNPLLSDADAALEDFLLKARGVVRSFSTQDSSW